MHYDYYYDYNYYNYIIFKNNLLMVDRDRVVRCYIFYFYHAISNDISINYSYMINLE
jgi:hypothetical protein